MIKKLLSLPPNLVDCFHDVTGLDREEYLCDNDPIDRKLGSGGGTTWLLKQHPVDGKKIILHAGGQSRRLPAYAPSGKILTPIPVFRWERGQRLSQSLLEIQLPLYERIMEVAPASLKTCIVSGDVFIRTSQPINNVPEADVVCYGLWLDADIAKDHGVFVCSRQDPTHLKCMLQKPSKQELAQLLDDNFYLTDIGIWLFSDRALDILKKRSTNADGEVTEYDMYSDFGRALGKQPGIKDDEINSLSVAIVPLEGGEFYHFGTSHELISSMLAIQNLVNDQREIIHNDRKPHTSIFVQNAITKIPFSSENRNIWIENSVIGSHWSLSQNNIITGVPDNDWHLSLTPGQCVDIVPLDKGWVVRPYTFYARFAGDRQTTPLFPIVHDINEVETVLKEMLSTMLEDGSPQPPAGYELLSAQDICNRADMRRLTAQRRKLRALNWDLLAANYKHSVFYQIDLDDAAHEFAAMNLDMPLPITENASLQTQMCDAMFRSRLNELKGADGSEYSQKAFSILREGLISSVANTRQHPRMDVYADQIVWGRSPVRIDIAGGWTDTPPNCLLEGGTVVNFAIELNGQQPIQTYVRPCKEHHFVLRSIDLGAMEVIDSYEALSHYNQVGSPFSIPKAALVLAGFHPDFSEVRYDSLTQQLEDFGGGLEVTLLSAIPAGSGLGTSSVLAATILGALSDFCGLGWSKNDICSYTLILEQMLTSGGGWQDQYGGVLPGVKLLRTSKGFDQQPVVSWLPSEIFTGADYKPCHLLYYTGITRTAKKILSEIVSSMFLNNGQQLRLLREMKEHTMDMYEAIQRADFDLYGRYVRKNWLQNQALDSGTNPPEVEALTRLIDDYCLGYKLPGAGGGGYLYIVAKDAVAASRIRQILTERRPNASARFVDMSISATGFQTSRS